MKLSVTKRIHSFTFTIECEHLEAPAAIRHLEEMSASVPDSRKDGAEKAYGLVPAPSVVNTKGLTDAVEMLVNSDWANPNPDMRALSQAMKAQGRKISTT